jgi:hypothetical protein
VLALGRGGKGPLALRAPWWWWRAGENKIQEARSKKQEGWSRGDDGQLGGGRCLEKGKGPVACCLLLTCRWLVVGFDGEELRVSCWWVVVAGGVGVGVGCWWLPVASGWACGRLDFAFRALRTAHEASGLRSHGQPLALAQQAQQHKHNTTHNKTT